MIAGCSGVDVVQACPKALIAAQHLPVTSRLRAAIGKPQGADLPACVRPAYDSNHLTCTSQYRALDDEGGQTRTPPPSVVAREADWSTC